MKRTRIYAIIAIAVIAAMCLCSCSKEEMLGTGLGLDEELIERGPDSKDTLSGLFYDDTELAAEFDTTANELFTIRQFVEGERIVVDGGDTLATEPFRRNLNLEVSFSIAPYKVYVEKDSLLNEVVLTSTTASEISEVEDKDDEFCTINKEQSYEFSFNANETVKADAVWQALRCEVTDTTFACVSVESVNYDSFVATLNESMSNADSTVYDIDLYFNVELASEKTAWDSTYVVRVPAIRIFKDGEVPEEPDDPEDPDEYETVVENEAYRAAFETATLSLLTDYQEVSGDLVTYMNDTLEVSRENFAKDLNLQALFSTPERVYVENEAQLTKVSLDFASHEGDIITRNSDGRFTTATSSLEYNFGFNEGEHVSAETEYQYLSYGDTTFVYSAIQNIRFNRAEVSENTAISNDELQVVNVTLYFNVEVVREDPQDRGRETTAPEIYEVAVPYERALRKELPEDMIEGRRAENVVREIVDANSERISWTEVETWTVSGEKTRTISFVLYRHFSEPAMQTVYTANDQYNTVSNGSSFVRESESINGNWTVTTRHMQYTSTANNGVDPFNNVYAYDFQKAVYTDEYYTLTFDYADWTINEGASTLTATGQETINGVVYNVTNYVNNINTVYTVSTNDRYDAAASADARILVEKPTEKIIPDEWGKIIGAGISAVPADDLKGSYARKCFTLRTEKGAVAIVFDMEDEMPSVSNIISGNFVEGSFGSEYNSAYWNGSQWNPAAAEDWSDRLAWLANGEVRRNLRHTTLAVWGWRDGNYSTVVEGYTFSTSNDGVLTVSYGGEVILQLR